jgi:hypothetical protein
MHGHELDAILPCIRLAFAGLQRGMRQERIERRHFLGRIRFETFRSAHQFLEVLDSRFAPLAFFFFKKLDKAAPARPRG